MARNAVFLKRPNFRRDSSPNALQHARSRFPRSRGGRILRFEPLEDRRVLATYTVTNLNDATVTGPESAPGTLRQAIYDANVSSDADVIDFAPGLSGDLRLSISDDSAIQLSAFLVTSPITIQGNTAGITIRRDITAPEMRFFRVSPSGDLTLDSLSLTGGITRGTNGASGQNGDIAYAGAIFNQGNLQVITSTLYNNTAIGGNAGAGANSGTGQGGAVFNDGGNVVIRNATLSGNSASNGFGFVLNRSYGGGVYTKNGLLTIDNSTITNGSAASGRALYIIGIGAGQSATAQIRSSIIAQSDIQIVAYDFNATNDLGGQVIVTGSNNIIRSQNDFESIAVSNNDPLLGPLALNGGPTRTHALLAASPAIGQGSNLLNLVNDQRGDTFARVVGGTVDIGAYELQTVVTPELPGDYNGSHAVDAADYVLWRKTKGADVPQYAEADGDGSSKIDDADYNVWRANFGAPSSASAAADVPPSTFGTIEEKANAHIENSQEAALFEVLADYAFLRSVNSSTNEAYRPLAVARPLSQHDRDTALLAITAVQFGLPLSTTTSLASNEELEPDAANRETEEIVLPLNVTESQLGSTPPLTRYCRA